MNWEITRLMGNIFKDHEAGEKVVSLGSEKKKSNRLVGLEYSLKNSAAGSTGIYSVLLLSIMRWRAMLLDIKLTHGRQVQLSYCLVRTCITSPMHC